jgi:hypothetical protein
VSLLLLRSSGMDAAKRETVRARLEARHQSLQRKLARVEGQIVQVEQQMMATRMRIAALTEGQRKAA